MVRKETELVGGRLCLDFVNTVSWRGTAEPRENLGTYSDLVRWCSRAGAVPRRDALALRRVAASYPRRAVTVLERARELREAIHRTLIAWKAGQAPATTDMALVNASAPPRGELYWKHGRFVWSRVATRSLESPLWPVVWSLADLVTSGEARRVSSCHSAACGWLFYDESRGQRRRWCSMSDCGNRAKARRHYARVSGSAVPRRPRAG